MTEHLSVISKSIRDQYQGTCYAHAFATVIRAAQSQGGFLKTEHEKIVKQAIQKFGHQGANLEKVLKELCPIYGMSWKRIDAKECETAISDKQGIIAGFSLTNRQWKKFSSFFKENPSGVMQNKDFMIIDDLFAESTGHAVVINGREQNYWKLKNSWGTDFANNGNFRISKVGLQFICYKVYYLPKYLMDEYTAGHIDLSTTNSKRFATYEDIREFDQVIKKLRGALVATNSLAPIIEEDKPTEIKYLKPVFEDGSKVIESKNFSYSRNCKDWYRQKVMFTKTPLNKVGIQQFTIKVEKNSDFGVGIVSEIYHAQSLNNSELSLGASKSCYIITSSSQIFADEKTSIAVNIENPARKPEQIPAGSPITVTVNFEKREISFEVQGITHTKVPMNPENIFTGESLYPVFLVFGDFDYRTEFI